MRRKGKNYDNPIIPRAAAKAAAFDWLAKFKMIVDVEVDLYGVTRQIWFSKKDDNKKLGFHH